MVSGTTSPAAKSPVSTMSAAGSARLTSPPAAIGTGSKSSAVIVTPSPPETAVNGLGSSSGSLLDSDATNVPGALVGRDHDRREDVDVAVAVVGAAGRV